jgi:hypothetical protein
VFMVKPCYVPQRNLNYIRLISTRAKIEFPRS